MIQNIKTKPRSSHQKEFVCTDKMTARSLKESLRCKLADYWPTHYSCLQAHLQKKKASPSKKAKIPLQPDSEKQNSSYSTKTAKRSVRGSANLKGNKEATPVKFYALKEYHGHKV